MDKSEIVKMLESDLESLMKKRTKLIENNAYGQSIELTRVIKETLALLSTYKEQPHPIHEIMTPSVIDFEKLGKMLSSFGVNIKDKHICNPNMLDVKKYFEMGIKEKKTTLICELGTKGIGKSFALMELAEKDQLTVVHHNSTPYDLMVKSYNTIFNKDVRFPHYCENDNLVFPHSKNNAIILVDGLEFKMVTYLINQGYTVIGCYR